MSARPLTRIELGKERVCFGRQAGFRVIGGGFHGSHELFAHTPPTRERLSRNRQANERLTVVGLLKASKEREERGCDPLDVADRHAVEAPVFLVDANEPRDAAGGREADIFCVGGGDVHCCCVGVRDGSSQGVVYCH